MYEPGVAGAVAEHVYDPSNPVVTVSMLALQLNTHTIFSPLTPAPFAVNVPETANAVLSRKRQLLIHIV